ncbi:DNA cytosine methyltransferase [Flavilitoribacter nigricans]|uniref:Cytosine-specific methyltransferase n=1 Tax=Flavilitoribacter nigricans (strain ATCC 23147 / DSM 23189 / NBRC 102662 / NCIMB 1420 / SS-2) TaxID=1122177 RepID=A0A2D0N7W5_FLAN2|nr:DNA cytosine methyltransferase [Flavilitoribacter nigricans]PHN04229.1 restriction endonuclease [Flavilitoribacter nigricans DSM 23189 = NBRC 102662]
MKFISLFSGAMGLDLGLEQCGFEPVICVENNSSAVETIKANRPKIKVFSESVIDFSVNTLDTLGIKKEDIELVAGGPPCQAFSVFGKRLGLNDVRGQMTFEFLRVVKEVQPKIFLMENVRGLLSMPLIPRKNAPKEIDNEYLKKGSLLKTLISDFNKIGYSVDCYVVNSVNYGAPQVRERVLLIGNKFGLESKFPKPRYSNRKQDKLPCFKTLGDIIGPDSGFVDPCPEVLNFSPRKLKYLSMIPEGGNWRSLPVDIQKESMGKSWYLKGGRSAYWRKLSFDFPSPTVVTMPNHAGTSMCHPTKLRAITIGEAAAIQEFPRDWEFKGTTSEKFKQIGNAVPVRLGVVAGEVIKNLINDIKSLSKKNVPPIREGFEIIKIRPHVRTRTFWKNGKAFSGTTSYYDKSTNGEEKESRQMRLPL